MPSLEAICLSLALWVMALWGLKELIDLIAS